MAATLDMGRRRLVAALAELEAAGAVTRRPDRVDVLLYAELVRAAPRLLESLGDSLAVCSQCPVLAACADVAGGFAFTVRLGHSPRHRSSGLRMSVSE